jgi:hypothetical protein
MPESAGNNITPVGVTARYLFSYPFQPSKGDSKWQPTPDPVNRKRRRRPRGKRQRLPRAEQQSNEGGTGDVAPASPLTKATDEGSQAAEQYSEPDLVDNKRQKPSKGRKRRTPSDEKPSAAAWNDNGQPSAAAAPTATMYVTERARQAEETEVRAATDSQRVVLVEQSEDSACVVASEQPVPKRALHAPAAHAAPLSQARHEPLNTSPLNTTSTAYACKVFETSRAHATPRFPRRLEKVPLGPALMLILTLPFLLFY